MRFKYFYSAVRLFYLSMDIFFVYTSIAIACILRQSTVPFYFTYTNIVIDKRNPFQFVIIFWIVTTILIINSSRLYQTKREVLKGVEVWVVIKSVAIASILSLVAIYGLKIQDFPRSIFLIGTILSMVFLSSWRLLKRGVVNYLVSHGYNNSNVLIIGAGKVGVLLKKEIERHPELGLKVVGFLDDFKVTDPKNSDVKILGNLSAFLRAVRREFVRKVFITIHHDSEVFFNILEQAKVLGIAVRVIPQGYEMITGEFLKYNIGIIPILEYSDHGPLRVQIGKRLFDFVVSFIAIIILSPVVLLIAVLIKLNSKGPVFYRSRRYGYQGKIFKMFKFRSMVKDADKLMKEMKDKNEVDGPIFKMKKDPRITKIGRFLRRYSLDELPQVLNVFLGEMSLVGPRPLPIDQVEREDLKQLKRLEIRPGITGLWQIKGRSDISFARLVRWDTWYINNWSFWLDINILLQTIPVVLKGRGAY